MFEHVSMCCRDNIDNIVDMNNIVAIVDTRSEWVHRLTALHSLEY